MTPFGTQFRGDAPSRGLTGAGLLRVVRANGDERDVNVEFVCEDLGDLCVDSLADLCATMRDEEGAISKDADAHAVRSTEPGDAVFDGNQRDASFLPAVVCVELLDGVLSEGKL